MDRHGYFSLGTNADYVAALIGRVPFFLEVNPRMPRTFGENQIHVSQLLGYCEADRPLGEVSVGDELVGFDELREPGRTRKFRKAVVQAVTWSVRPTLRSLGAYWIVRGDEDKDASDRLEYRKVDDVSGATIRRGTQEDHPAGTC